MTYAVFRTFKSERVAPGLVGFGNGDLSKGPGQAAKPLAATVSVMHTGREVAPEPVGESGAATFASPATAILVIQAPGFDETKRDLYLDRPSSDSAATSSVSRRPKPATICGRCWTS